MSLDVELSAPICREPAEVRVILELDPDPIVEQAIAFWPDQAQAMVDIAARLTGKTPLVADRAVVMRHRSGAMTVVPMFRGQACTTIWLSPRVWRLLSDRMLLR